jgi:hypothetical protein
MPVAIDDPSVPSHPVTILLAGRLRLREAAVGQLV